MCDPTGLFVGGERRWFLPSFLLPALLAAAGCDGGSPAADTGGDADDGGAEALPDAADADAEAGPEAPGADGDEAGDGDDGETGPEPRCRVDQPFPYLDSPYVGLHGNAANNERIPCAGPEAPPTPGWQALDGHLIFNPITVGPDRLYAVVAQTDGCKLWTVDLDDGDERCLPTEDPENLSFGVLGASPELDEDGNVYVTDGWDTQPDGVVSYASDGSLRWRRTFESLHAPGEGGYWPPLGVHFTSAGHVATVTADGIVVLLAREPGEPGILATLDVPEELGFAPLPATPLTIPEELPLYLQCRIQSILGDAIPTDELLAALAGGTGGSGHWGDNTIAATGDLLFAVGGGPDNGTGVADDGALVALRVGGTPAAPELEVLWYMLTNGATGSSPTIDPAGRRVVVTDATAEGHGRLVVADIDACAAVVGTEPPECDPAWIYELPGGPLNAHVSIDEDGVVYAWNQGADAEGEPRMPELMAVAPPDAAHAAAWAKWTAHFPPTTPGRWTSSEWSSTALVLDNMIVGTVTHLVAAPIEGLDLPLPIALRTEHEVVAVRRDTGEELWRGVPLTDDSINSPLLGPDGNIYVPILGMIDFAHVPAGAPPETCDDFVDEDFQGGIAQYVSPGGP